MTEGERTYAGRPIIRATFQPKRLDTLKPDAAEHVGETFDWEFLWEIGEDDSAVYAGQAAWQPLDPNRALPWFGWVPTEDLEEIAL